jgi:hypothetical protein
MEDTPATKTVSSTKPAAKSSTKPTSDLSGSAFEFPKFGMPNFEMPKMEVPAAFREFAEKGVSQARENYEKMKTAAEEANGLLEDTYTAVSKGATEYGFKVIEAARTNTNAAVLDRACPQTVRDSHLPEQGTRDPGPEGGD